MSLCTGVLISPSPDQEGNKLQRPNSNFCKPLKKKKIRRLSVQPGLRGSNDLRVGRKMATFQLFFSQVGLRTYQHPCIGDRLVVCSLWWSSIQACIPNGHLYGVTYQMYWYDSWWWAHGCSKHVENWNKHIRKKNCASCGYSPELYRDARSEKHKKARVRFCHLSNGIRKRCRLE
jgi:ribosomal protein L37E